MIGTTIGAYQVLRLIGQGGMGAVYEGIQQPIGRRVAIKVLHPDYASNQEIAKRFFNEARAANLIAHPSIVQISDFGQMPNGAPYLVMEFLEGETLADRLERSGGRLPEELALHIIWQVASALEVAHARGIVHRDLKPSNVMLIPDSVMPSGERVKVVDLGIAKLEGLVTASRPTRSGSVLGTPLYMAPEQCKGANQVDGKADVYSLGVMLFELLSGQPPFVASSDLALLNMHVSKPPPSLLQRVPDVSGEVADLVECMLRKKPAERISMAGLVKLLQKLGSTQSREQTALGALVQHSAQPIDPMAKTADPEDAPARLPSGSGQKVSIHGRLRRHYLVGAGALGLIAVLGLLYVGGRVRHEGQRVSSAVSSGQDSPLPDASLRTDTGATAGPQATGQPGTKPQCPVEIETTPSGALILSAEDERELGTTPWSSQLAADRGDVWLLIRKSGYRDRLLRLSPKAGMSIGRHEVLAPAASAPVPGQQRNSHKALSHRASSQQVINRLKERLRANPDMGTEADIPDTYRIVD